MMKKNHSKVLIKIYNLSLLMIIENSTVNNLNQLEVEFCTVFLNLWIKIHNTVIMIKDVK